MSATPSNDVLFERLERFGEQLELHRLEAREANAETSRKLDEVLELRGRIAFVEESNRALSQTVNGEKDEPGMKGRLDRAERTLGTFIWIGCAIVLAVIGLLIDVFKKKTGVVP